ncbi:unnamed protein product [Musa acuminata var. zebrina]
MPPPSVSPNSPPLPFVPLASATNTMPSASMRFAKLASRRPNTSRTLMECSSRRSNSAVPPVSRPLLRSASPAAVAGAAPFSSSYRSSASSPFASSSSANSSTFFHHRSASPTRVYLVGSTPSPRTPSVHFSLDRSTSPGRSLAVVDRRRPASASAAAPARRTCMCSPTTHPGSFRCSLHKGLRFPPHHNQHAASSSPSNRLNARRSAMTNSLVRIGAVEGEWVKRALASLIRPSSHQQRRRADFRPRLSRLSVMSRADDV